LPASSHCSAPPGWPDANPDSHDFAGNPRILVEAVDGAEPMVAIRDEDLVILRVANHKQWRERLATSDFPAVGFHVRIAYSEQ
jgi:hypothetical protein